ncbi:MAG: hypothetical protein EOM28_02575 [Clostridia bacterium]|nr:hypothetical protein [Anaerotignum sp.]NCC15223.1 hypothetical protein [Clostridia bacterium]
MSWLEILKKAFGTGILCTLMYYGTLFVMGQPVALKNAVIFAVVFILLYSIWLFMASIGKKK